MICPNHMCCWHLRTSRRPVGSTTIVLLKKSRAFSSMLNECSTLSRSPISPLTYLDNRLESSNKFWPVSMKNVITPRDQTSTAIVYGRFDASPSRNHGITSGAIKAGVPVIVRRAVSPSVARLLIPKSAIFTHQSGPLHATNIFYSLARQSRNNYHDEDRIGVFDQEYIWFQVPMSKVMIMHEL